MEQSRIVSRRSFLAQVTGAALIAAVASSPGQARRRRRRMVVDTDPSDLARPLTAPPRPRITASPPPPYPGTPDDGAGPPSVPPGPGRAPLSRFVICPGNRRCPGRNR